MSRYTNITTTKNDSDFYSPLAQKRGLKSIQQMNTVVLKNPQIFERIGLATDTHIWKYGDRFYNLAHQYYGDARYWWVISWWNGHPTEVTIETGNFLDIPLDLSRALEVLRSPNAE